MKDKRKQWLHIARTKTLHIICSGVSEGENEVAGRIRFLAKFKQPKAIVLCALVAVVACVSIFCLGGEASIVSVEKEGIFPYALSESEEYLLQSFSMDGTSQILSFCAPEEAITLYVNIYLLEEDATWNSVSNGGISIGTEREPIDQLVGTFAMQLQPDLAIDYVVNAGGLASYETDAILLGSETMASTKVFLQEFREIAINTEIPVALMVYDSGNSMRSYTLQDYFEPSTFADMDVVQIVTLEFSDQPFSPADNNTTAPEETDSEQIPYADYTMDDQIFIDNPTRYDAETFYDLMMETPIVLNDTEILLGQTPFSALSQSDWIVVDQTEASSDIECDANSFQTLTLQRTETQSSWKDPVDGSPYSIGVALFNESDTTVVQNDAKIAAVAFRNIPSSYLIALANGDLDDVDPTITILDGLTLGSTVEDVVAMLGSPTGIWYGDCTWLGTNDAGDHVSLILQFAEDGSLINFLLCYSHHMFNQ